MLENPGMNKYYPKFSWVSKNVSSVDLSKMVQNTEEIAKNNKLKMSNASC